MAAMSSPIAQLIAFIRRALASCWQLVSDTSGNVMVIAAASLFPLLALIGSGIDMGRGYLAQTRLQQACDAGALAARKRLGTMVAVGGQIPESVAETGQRFFNINFRQGSYGSLNRRFVMELEEDLSITGTATASVPTTIMGAFGFDEMEIAAHCTAQVSMPNTDIMMVLDVTGSMLFTNPGDSENRINVLRATVKNFHAQMEANKTQGTRIRYGFVPYSTNVNVGHLLRPEWLVNEWSYNYRVPSNGGSTEEQPIYETRYTYVSGSIVDSTAVYQETCPADTRTYELLEQWVDAEGWSNQRLRENGVAYSCSQVDTNRYAVTSRSFHDHVYIWATRQTGTQTVENRKWRYAKMPFDLSFLQTSNSTTANIGGSASNPTPIMVSYRGCIEERDTYEIDDYNNVDLSRALDLDIDRVPTPGVPATQWRPMLNELSWLREIRMNGRGTFTPGTVVSSEEFVNAYWWGYGACPAPTRKLAEMNANEVANYVDNLVPNGSTYHDIGMIWGGRLLSPTGLFATENADVNGRSTSRHLIFLTDGETAPLDISYGSYGIEPLDRRRWKQTSPLSLTQTVERRFSFACEEVKKRNITVWVVSFGTDANPIMQNCAGPDRYFVADNAAELQQSFAEIVRRLGDLRIVH